MRTRRTQRNVLLKGRYSGVRSSSSIIIAIAAVIAIVLIINTDATAQSPRAEPTAQGDVTHGKYLVEDVAMCGQCHTPHEGEESTSRSRQLQGAPVPWLPSKPESDWAITAPRIGGTPLPATDADLIKLLTTGIWTTGNRLRPPMPQFRMSRSDAEAIVAYLKSVNPQP